MARLYAGEVGSGVTDRATASIIALRADDVINDRRMSYAAGKQSAEDEEETSSHNEHAVNLHPSTFKSRRVDRLPAMRSRIGETGCLLVRDRQFNITIRRDALHQFSVDALDKHASIMVIAGS